MKSIIFTSVMLLLGVQTAFAEQKTGVSQKVQKATVLPEWKKIAAVKSSDYFIDNKSVKMIGDGPVIIEAVIQQKALANSGKLKKGELLVTNVHYNCDDNSFQLGLASKFNTAGKLVYKTKEKDRVYTYIGVEESKPQEMLYKHVCAQVDELSKTYVPVEDTGIYND